MNLDTPIEKIPKIGFFHSSRLKKIKIITLEDLLNHYPFRYEDLGETKKIKDLLLGSFAATAGQVLQIKNIRTRYGKRLTLATIYDGTGTIETVWFNQPFLTKTILLGNKIRLAGKIESFSQKQTFINPEYEVVQGSRKAGLHTEGLVPIYPETSGISSKWFRTRIKVLLPQVLQQVTEILPEETLKRNNLIRKPQALWKIHFPKSSKQVDEARLRLGFEEVLLIHLKMAKTKEKWKQNLTAVKQKTDQEKTLQLISTLPFNLTSAQSKVAREIFADLDSIKPMNRILQGDVGSGKTVLAALAAYNVFLNGYQTALMAPTGILATQHLNTLKAILAPKGLKVGLRTSHHKQKGQYDVLVGTHALISKENEFEKLALVIIDEQHRFGVKQRAILRSKGKTPHVLTMTATPIPRSLALTLYGDLDISTLDELPPGRRKVKTFVVPPEKRVKAYQFIREQVTKGKQAFILCPLIEPSETLGSVKAAAEEYQKLQKEVFPDLNLGLLHGRLKTNEKEQILDSFKKNEINILVATPVVEVGIDIPGATIMMVEAAERFGLASLHQLRGRVGRSSDQAYCFLFTESSGKQVANRLAALEKHFLGSELAEIDLKNRGPGELYGTAQSGLPTLKIASLSDITLIKQTRAEALLLYEKLDSNALLGVRNMLEKYGAISPD